MRFSSSLIPHPSSLIPHPSSLIPHPSSLIPHPSSLIPHPSSLIPHPSSLFPHPSSLFPLPLPHPLANGSGDALRVWDSLQNQRCCVAVLHLDSDPADAQQPLEWSAG